MEELLKQLRESVFNRLRNPLIVSFAIAWLLWNYRLVLVVIGDGKFEDKIGFIDRSLFHSFAERVLLVVIAPLVTASLYTFVWPWFDRKIKVFYLRQQNATMKAEFEEQKKAPMDTEAQASLYAEHEKEVKRLETAINSLNVLVARERGEFAETRDKLSRQVNIQAISRMSDQSGADPEQVLKLLQGIDRLESPAMWNDQTRANCMKNLPLSHIVPLSRFVMLTQDEPQKNSGELSLSISRAKELAGDAPSNFLEVLEAAGLGFVDRWGEFYVHVEHAPPREAVLEIHRTVDPAGFKLLKDSLRDRAMREMKPLARNG